MNKKQKNNKKKTTKKQQNKQTNKTKTQVKRIFPLIWKIILLIVSPSSMQQ